MSNKNSSFGKQVFNNTTFALLDTILVKIGTTLAFILLVRLLPASDIASIGIATGYLVLVAYLEIGPIRILLRDYPQISQDRYQRDHLLTALFLFWGVQSLMMLLLCVGVQFLILDRLALPGLSFLFFGLVVDFIVLSFQDWIKTVYYADFRQVVATKIGFLLTLLRFASYGLLLVWPFLITYAWILIIIALLNCMVWGALFQKHFNYRPVVDNQTVNTLKYSLNSYGLWDHFNRVSIDTIFMIDTVVLSWFIIDRLQDIGNYAIALRFTSLFFLIPWQLQRSLQVVLANYTDHSKQVEAINTYLKLSAFISLTQLFFVISGGKWMLLLLFGFDIHPDVVTYSLIIATGVTIMGAGLPMLSVINNFCSLRRAFFVVFLPMLIMGFIIYMVAASMWGALGVAVSNIVIYSMLTLSLILFTAKHYPMQFEFQLLTAAEKRLLHELVGRRF